MRRYCQVRLSLARNKFGGGEPSKEPQALGTALPDTALSSLLELLVGRLGADIAMAILLDEETQFFRLELGRTTASLLLNLGWSEINLLGLRVSCEIFAETSVL